MAETEAPETPEQSAPEQQLEQQAPEQQLEQLAPEQQSAETLEQQPTENLPQGNIESPNSSPEEMSGGYLGSEYTFAYE